MKLITKLKIYLALLLIINIPFISLANPGKYVTLNKGESIPWSGWCFDQEAIAKILSDKELQQEKCQLKLSKQEEQNNAAFELQIGKLKAEKLYEIEIREEAIQALKKENLIIENAIIHEQKFGWIAPASIGAIIGALTVFLVTL